MGSSSGISASIITNIKGKMYRSLFIRCVVIVGVPILDQDLISNLQGIKILIKLELNFDEGGIEFQ
jgi:hypothetical protein